MIVLFVFSANLSAREGVPNLITLSLSGAFSFQTVSETERERERSGEIKSLVSSIIPFQSNVITLITNTY